MKAINAELASTTISSLLDGMSLDSLRVYSTILLLGFYRTASSSDLPNEVWISCSGNVVFDNLLADASGMSPKATDFFADRADVLSQLYRLIGTDVASVDIDSLGTLTVEISGKKIKFARDEESLEEVWSVMSDSPATSEPHRWYVALDDAGEIGGEIPAPLIA